MKSVIDSKIVYCPYTDSFIDIANTSPEHILPLALGGANGFEIPVDKEFNRIIGSEIDGKLAEDFIIKLNRVKYRIKGHSKREPTYVAKNGKMEGKETNVRIDINREKGIEIWDSRDGIPIPFTSNVKFTASQNIIEMRTTRLRFIAKAALSGGYFVYEKLFIDAVKHNDLRLIMNYGNNLDDPRLKSIEAKCDVQFSDDKNPVIMAFKYVTSIVDNSSCIGFIPFENSIAFFVGILGVYIGMIRVPCDQSKMPKDGIHEWGTFVCIQEKKPVICSWKRLMTRITEKATAK
jgi:hypothetical protein